MKPITALGSGLAGAITLSLIHESVKRIVPEAPRLDLLGMNAVSKGLKASGIKPPSQAALFTWALAGDLISNSIYYSLADVGKGGKTWKKSALLGLAAGIGAVTLSGPLGLKEKYTGKTI